MLPFDADPVLAEVREIADELRRVRLALNSGQHDGRQHDDGQASAARPAGEQQLLSGTEADLEQEHLAEQSALQERLGAILVDAAHRATIERALDERARTLRIAVHAWRDELRAAQAHDVSTRILGAAASAGRDLTTVERARVRELQERTPADTWHRAITSTALRDDVLEAFGKLRVRAARAQLRTGLLLTGQMRGIISEALPAIRRGEPVLFVGETGGAKTALAEYLARHSVDTCASAEPELISGYGDITSSQVIGSHELRAEGGATVTAFVPGPLLRAMTEGRPVILDEINAMPAEFLKRLNRILQLRPGDHYSVQENAGRGVRVAQGFAILATANEQTPHRYRGLDRLSAELVNRFGANGYRVHYPDSGRAYDETPSENLLLATAAVVDARGELPSSISPDELQRVARAAFISQQVFAGAHGTGFETYVSTEREIDGRPGLDEAVLAPRTLVAILQKVAGSAGAVSLDRALSRFVESVMHREDRRVLTLIIEGQGFRV